MTYDEDLAARIRELVNDQGTVTEKRMFGGLAFLLDDHMAVCASGRGGLLVRVDAQDLEAFLGREHVEPMDMGGRRSRTWLHVTTDGVRTKRQLRAWVTRGVTTVVALPPKG